MLLAGRLPCKDDTLTTLGPGSKPGVQEIYFAERAHKGDPLHRAMGHTMFKAVSIADHVTHE